MADDLNNRGPQDRARISTTEAHEVRYWTKELGVSKERLASVVARVGNSAEAARRELGRYGIRRESGSRKSVSSNTAARVAGLIYRGGPAWGPPIQDRKKQASPDRARTWTQAAA
jgi:hypothetical protein